MKPASKFALLATGALGLLAWGCGTPNDQVMAPGSASNPPSQPSGPPFLASSLSPTPFYPPAKFTPMVGSATPTGSPSPHFFSSPSLDFTGRNVAFLSNSDQLVPGSAGQQGAFRKDMVSGGVVCASRPHNSTTAFANGACQSISISSDGSKVAFEALATNLTSHSYAANVRYAFVRQLSNNATLLLSHAFQQPASSSSLSKFNGNSRVLFSAPFIANGDAKSELLEHDLEFNQIHLRQPQADWSLHSITRGCLSEDGTYLAAEVGGKIFFSNRDQNTTEDVTQWVTAGTCDSPTLSRSGLTLAYRGPGASLWGWQYPSRQRLKLDAQLADSRLELSDEGRYLVYSRNDDASYSGDSNGRPDIYVADLFSGARARVTDSIFPDPCLSPSISGDGKRIAFTSGSKIYLVSNPFTSWSPPATPTVVSKSQSGAGANQSCGAPDLSYDGRFVAFASGATNLVTPAPTGQRHAYRKCLTSGSLYRASAPRNSAGEIEPFTSSLVVPIFGDSVEAKISELGHRIAFNSRDPLDLEVQQYSSATQVFVSDAVRRDVKMITAVTIGNLRMPSPSSHYLAGFGGDRWIATQWGTNSPSLYLRDADAPYALGQFVNLGDDWQGGAVDVSSDGLQLFTKVLNHFVLKSPAGTSINPGVQQITWPVASMATRSSRFAYYVPYGGTSSIQTVNLQDPWGRLNINDPSLTLDRCPLSADGRFLAYRSGLSILVTDVSGPLVNTKSAALAANVTNLTMSGDGRTLAWLSGGQVYIVKNPHL